MRRTLNLGIVAHVDAGKTSLTERLLHTVGAIDELGSVDAGSTRTDTLALERQRGITIRAAVVAFTVGDLAVNLIDTPGHPDFIAEVERVLGVLDGAVLVVSAVEGVQPQTRVLMRTLRRLGIPTVVFVNKIDRRGAGFERVLGDLASRLVARFVATGTVTGLGTPAAAWVPRSDEAVDPVLAEALAEHDDGILAAYVDGAVPTVGQLRPELARQTAAGRVHPVVFGSAITGAGADALLEAVRTLLPPAADDPDAPASGTVFKVERGSAGEKVAYCRMFAGTLRPRDRVGSRSGRGQKVTGIGVFDGGAEQRRDAVVAGEIARLWGLAEVQVGDVIGEPARPAAHGAAFAPPTLETVVEPLRPADRGVLHVALSQLAEQDPLIGLRLDAEDGAPVVSLYGEVQQEVLQATLAQEYGVAVRFRETRTLCVERPVGSGTAVQVIAEEPNPFLATVGLRVEPGPPGAGLRFGLEVEPGSMPPAFFTAVEEGVRQGLRAGPHGWEVVDVAVTMTRSGYWARQSHAHGTFDKSMSSTAGDFRQLSALVFRQALEAAGTRVEEPVHRFRLETPADSLGAVLPVLGRLRAVPDPPVPAGTSFVVGGELPAACVHELRRLLPTLTSGEGVLETAFARYQPVPGGLPLRW